MKGGDGRGRELLVPGSAKKGVIEIRHRRIPRLASVADASSYLTVSGSDLGWLTLSGLAEFDELTRSIRLSVSVSLLAKGGEDYDKRAFLRESAKKRAAEARHQVVGRTHGGNLYLHHAELDSRNLPVNRLSGYTTSSICDSED